MSGGDPGGLHDADGVAEVRGEGRVVVVGDRPILVADGSVLVADDRTKRHRALGDDRGQGATGHAGDVPSQEFRDVGHVAAHIGQGTGAGCTLVAPAPRRLR